MGEMRKGEDAETRGRGEGRTPNIQQRTSNTEVGARQEPRPTGPREDAAESKLPTPNIQRSAFSSEGENG